MEPFRWCVKLCVLLAASALLVAAQTRPLAAFVEDETKKSFTVAAHSAEAYPWLRDTDGISLKQDSALNPDIVTLALTRTTQEKHGPINAVWQRREKLRLEYLLDEGLLKLIRCEPALEEKAPLGKWRPAEASSKSCEAMPVELSFR